MHTPVHCCACSTYMSLEQALHSFRWKLFTLLISGWYNFINLICQTWYSRYLWVGTPILRHGREVSRWWPPFWGFTIRLGPYFIPQHNPIDPLFLQKISLSLSHLLPEILGPKIGLIFHQNVLFNRFKVFYINFLLISDPIDPHFHLFLIFLTNHFHKTLDPIGSKKKIACWTQVPNIL